MKGYGGSKALAAEVARNQHQLLSAFSLARES